MLLTPNPERQGAVASAKEIARICRTLAVPARVGIVQLLKQRPLCVGALARLLQLTPGAVSQHLRLLRDAGLVEPERRGYFIHYRLNGEVLAQWREALSAFLGRTASDDGLMITKGGEDLCALKTTAAKNPQS